jgi:hypothetical protein
MLTIADYSYYTLPSPSSVVFVQIKSVHLNAREERSSKVTGKGCQCHPTVVTTPNQKSDGADALLLIRKAMGQMSKLTCNHTVMFCITSTPSIVHKLHVICKMSMNEVWNFCAVMGYLGHLERK